MYSLLNTNLMTRRDERFGMDLLMTLHEEAFDALPEPYKADSCLEFWLNDRGVLYCAPKKDQEFALGRWHAYFDKEEAWKIQKSP